MTKSDLDAVDRTIDRDGRSAGAARIRPESQDENRLSLACISVFSLAGVFLTLWGFRNSAGQNLSVFTEAGFIRYAGFLAACIISTAVGAKWLQRSPITVGAAIAILLALLTGTAWPLLVACWFFVASAILGRAILSVLGIKKENANRVLDFLTGAGAYGTAVGLLAHFPLSYPGIYGVALAAPLILGRRLLQEWAASFSAFLGTSRPLRIQVGLLDVGIATIALVHFVTALLPELSNDALTMHLFIPGQLALRHQWGFDAGTYVWAVMPMLGEWIFSIGYMLGGEPAARIVNVGFILTIGWLIRDLALWAGGTGVGARWAILIFLSTPLTFNESSSLHIESVWASFAIAGTLAVLQTCSLSGNQKANLRIAGIFLGYALATKAPALLLLPVLSALMIWRYRTWFRPDFFRSLAIGSGLLIIAGSIPYVTAYCLTKNPVFPFFNGIFQSPYLPPVNFKAPAVFEIGTRWDVLYQITFNSAKYLEGKIGSAGFQWLLLLIPATTAALLKKDRRSLLLFLVSVFFVILNFHFTAYLRYVFPACALLSAFIGIALLSKAERFPYLHKPLLAIAGTTIALNTCFFSAASAYGDFPINALSDETNRASYLQTRLPIRNAVEIVNRLNPENIPVAFLSPPLIAGLAADGLVVGWHNPSFTFSLRDAKDEDMMADALVKRRVKFVIMSRNWGDEGKRALIERITDKVSDLGSVSVRVLRNEYRFRTELLESPDFASPRGWSLPRSVKFPAPDGFAANIKSPVTQTVPATPGTYYLETVEAQCDSQPTQGRLQVNWLDQKHKHIVSNIRLFECTHSLHDYSMEVSAPPGAAFAVVYLTSHTSVPVRFEAASFRK